MYKALIFPLKNKLFAPDGNKKDDNICPDFGTMYRSLYKTECLRAQMDNSDNNLCMIHGSYVKEKDTIL